MCRFNFLFFISFCIGFTTYAQSLFESDWKRGSLNDGYVIGNGEMYVVGGLGLELTRKGKTDFCGERVSLSKIGWLIGPSYALGNLGHGWHTIPTVNGIESKWESESIITPDFENNNYRVNGSVAGVGYELEDCLLQSENLLIRRYHFYNSSDKKLSLSVNVPIEAEYRNSFHGMFHGGAIDKEQIEEWGYYCGPNLRSRGSIPADSLFEIIDGNIIVLRGADRSLWQDMSTLVPDDELHTLIFKRRIALSSIHINGDYKFVTTQNGYNVDFGAINPSESVSFDILIMTAWGGEQERSQISKFKDIVTSFNGAGDLQNSESRYKNDLVISKDPNMQSYIKIINSSINLALSCKSDIGGVMAQPYMYPLYYVRDQYGSVKLFATAQRVKELKDLLFFYVAQQNKQGIQNAYDPLPGIQDPMIWDKEANAKDGHHSRAEVPSYIILFAKEYYLATGDLATLKHLYPRLQYNVEVQKLSKNGVLPYAEDESYTNFKETKPQFEEEMTDSHLLYLSAVDFMGRLAKDLGYKKDVEKYKELYRKAYDVLFERMWNSDGKYFLYARDDSQSRENIDYRPAFDPLARWSYLSLGTAQDDISTSCIDKILKDLINPVKVVPNNRFATGSEPGYLLYALAENQHPLAHEAAELTSRYVSNNGLMSEFYFYSDNYIEPAGGVLRPWESAVTGYCMFQYLTGLKIDIPAKSISLRPHLPNGCNSWESGDIPLGDSEGALGFSIDRVGDKVTFVVTRVGGKTDFELSVEFGLFEGANSITLIANGKQFTTKSNTATTIKLKNNEY